MEDGNHPNGITFERLNPKIGYVKGNVIIVSKMANEIKSSLTKEDFLDGTVDNIISFLEKRLELVRSPLSLVNNS